MRLKLRHTATILMTEIQEHFGLPPNASLSRTVTITPLGEPPGPGTCLEFQWETEDTAGATPPTPETTARRRARSSGAAPEPGSAPSLAASATGPTVEPPGTARSFVPTPTPPSTPTPASAVDPLASTQPAPTVVTVPTERLLPPAGWLDRIAPPPATPAAPAAPPPVTGGNAALLAGPMTASEAERASHGEGTMGLVTKCGRVVCAACLARDGAKLALGGRDFFHWLWAPRPSTGELATRCDSCGKQLLVEQCELRYSPPGDAAAAPAPVPPTDPAPAPPAPTGPAPTVVRPRRQPTLPGVS
jgi:hypothetical protein